MKSKTKYFLPEPGRNLVTGHMERNSDARPSDKYYPQITQSTGVLNRYRK